MAGIKTTDPGAQRHIKSTVSIKDGIFDENSIPCLNLLYGIKSLDPGVHGAIILNPQ